MPNPAPEPIEPDTDAAPAAARRPAKARWVAAGFLGAFATSILTVILTGLWVRSPDSKRPDFRALAASAAAESSRTHYWVLTSAAELEDVELMLELPDAVRIAGHKDRRELHWRTRLGAGANVVPLVLVAAKDRGGRLVARVRHVSGEQAFAIDVAAAGPATVAATPIEGGVELDVTLQVLDDVVGVDGAWLALEDR